MFLHELNNHMSKTFVLSILLATASSLCYAQSESNEVEAASQTAVLALSNGIDISYVSTSGSTGNAASMTFSSMSDYANGVMSAMQEMRVRSNNSFKVAVRCDEQTFAYQGEASDVSMSDMPNNALWMKVAQNNTGGSLVGGFSSNGFAALTSSNQDILTNGVRGGNRTFKVQYKCTPGFVLPAGTYSLDVVFTATQE